MTQLTQERPEELSVSTGLANGRGKPDRHLRAGPDDSNWKSQAAMPAAMPNPTTDTKLVDDRQPRNNLLRVTAQVVAIIATFGVLGMAITTSNPANRQLAMAIAIIALLLTLRLSESPITSTSNRKSNA